MHAARKIASMIYGWEYEVIRWKCAPPYPIKCIPIKHLFSIKRNGTLSHKVRESNFNSEYKVDKSLRFSLRPNYDWFCGLLLGRSRVVCARFQSLASFIVIRSSFFAHWMRISAILLQLFLWNRAKVWSCVWEWDFRISCTHDASMKWLTYIF